MQNPLMYHTDCLVAFKMDSTEVIQLRQVYDLVKDYMTNPDTFSEKEDSFTLESQDTSKIYRASFHGDYIALSGPINIISQLAVELKRVLREVEEVTVFDQSYNHSVDVSDYTTAIEIEKVFTK